MRRTHVFARLSPAHKQRIIRALQHKGHVVGFMGDGINDAPALHVADVGISVDSAVDIAKAAAAVILLEKDLMVLDDGVIEGRKVFVNILKYVRMGASSNFGNMFSVLGASAFLPFVPMLPIQVLTNNLLYDFSQVPIPTDTVGPEQTAEAATMEHRRHQEVRPLHRPHQLDFRLHDFLRDALCLRLLESGARRALSNRLVCRVADNANADRPRHSHEQDPLHPGPGELAAHHDYPDDHGAGRVAAPLAACSGARVHRAPAALLADPPRDAPLLRYPHPDSEDVADPESVAVMRWIQAKPSARAKARTRAIRANNYCTFTSIVFVLATGLFGRSARFAIIGLLLAASSLTGVAAPRQTGSLRPGAFFWEPELSPSGPLVLIISLREQTLSVYRNGIRIARSSISSGRKGRSTPAGVFTILEKEVTHFSNKYHHAPMPYMQRLTWQGIALHGGDLPGYQASHGCIRLPKAFAKLLYTITTCGTTVIVMGEKAPEPRLAAQPGMIWWPREAGAIAAA